MVDCTIESSLHNRVAFEMDRSRDFEFQGCVQQPGSAICFSYPQFELDLTTSFVLGQHEGHFICDSGHFGKCETNFLVGSQVCIPAFKIVLLVRKEEGCMGNL
jgi:hypothetical protein